MFIKFLESKLAFRVPSTSDDARMLAYRVSQTTDSSGNQTTHLYKYYFDLSISFVVWCEISRKINFSEVSRTDNQWWWRKVFSISMWWLAWDENTLKKRNARELSDQQKEDVDNQS